MEKRLGLVELTPIEKLYDNPCANNLESIPKTNQTYDMLVHVCSNDGMALEYASKKLITSELCEIAIKQNGLALEYVPKKIKDEKGLSWYNRLCEIAVSQNGKAIRSISRELLTSDIIEKALSKKDESEDGRIYEQTIYPIAYVPEDLLTKELLEKAIEYYPLCIKNIPRKMITKSLSRKAALGDWRTLKYIPNRFVKGEIAEIAISQNPMAIKFIQQEALDPSVCQKCFEKDPGTLGYIPSAYITKEMCLKVIEKDRLFVLEPPEETLVEKFGTNDVGIVLFGDFPESIRNDRTILEIVIQNDKDSPLQLIWWNDEVRERIKGEFPLRDKRKEVINPLRRQTIEYLKTKISASEEISDEGITPLKIEAAALMNTAVVELPSKKISRKSKELRINANDVPGFTDLSVGSAAGLKVHYVSDIHLEHQLSKTFEKLGNKPKEKQVSLVVEAISDKIHEMVSEVKDENDILLIGGDVASSKELAAEFYHELYCQWRGGIIISILGNHELWDGTTEKDWVDSRFVSRPVEEIVDDYKAIIGRGIGETDDLDSFLSEDLYYDEQDVNSILLENELYILYKNKVSRIVPEEDIVTASEEELADLLSKCTLIVLGGIGYSGLNPVYNAQTGLYRRAIDGIDEDVRRTERFRTVYNKVFDCAKDRQVIVLSHTPMRDWSDDVYNKNWIYVSGHTHQDELILSEDGTTVFSDNQVGYKPKKWKLNAFMVDKLWYDPFESYKDGIYEITSDQYREFNKGRGIMCKGCSYPGTLFALKRGKMYMFLLQTPQNLCLMVGGQRKSLKNKEVMYYFANMRLYAERVRKLISPYQAIMQRLSEEVKKIGGTGKIHGCIVDISFLSHIYVNPYDGKMTPYWAWDITARRPFANVEKLLEKKEPRLLQQFYVENQKDELPLIGTKSSSKPVKYKQAALPTWVFGTEIYEPSRIMKAIQFVWEQNVIRIWNDDVLSEKGQKQSLLPLGTRRDKK